MARSRKRSLGTDTHMECPQHTARLVADRRQGVGEREGQQQNPQLTLISMLGRTLQYLADASPGTDF